MLLVFLITVQNSINIIVNLLNVVYYINRWQNVIFMGFLYGKANIYNQG